jgi:hypothetical protein
MENTMTELSMGQFVTSDPCPHYPQKQTLELSRVTSALCQKQTF